MPYTKSCLQDDLATPKEKSSSSWSKVSWWIIQRGYESHLFPWQSEHWDVSCRQGVYNSQ